MVRKFKLFVIYTNLVFILLGIFGIVGIVLLFLISSRTEYIDLEIALALFVIIGPPLFSTIAIFLHRKKLNSKILNIVVNILHFCLLLGNCYLLLAFVTSLRLLSQKLGELESPVVRNSVVLFYIFLAGIYLLMLPLVNFFALSLNVKEFILKITKIKVPTSLFFKIASSLGFCSLLFVVSTTLIMIVLVVYSSLS